MKLSLKIHALLILIFVFTINISFTQAISKTIPLHKFLQDNFDSSIIYNPSSVWEFDNEYLIITKLNGFVLYFTYLNPYKSLSGKYLPKSIAAKFGRESKKFRASLPDTNRYFLPKPIYDSTNRNSSWNNIIRQNIWTIKDDDTLGQGCGNLMCSIFDADDHRFYLITKAGIKQLHFYAPSYYYKNCCPNKQGLKEAISIIKTFQNTFGYQLNLIATTSSN